MLAARLAVYADKIAADGVFDSALSTLAAESPFGRHWNPTDRTHFDAHPSDVIEDEDASKD